MKALFAAAFASTIALAATTARAETIAYAVPTATAGTQNFTGTLGLDFDVAAPVYVYALGVFDSGGDGLARPLTARIYDRTSHAEIVALAFPMGMTGTLVGGSRFLPLPCPLALPAGFHGVIAAEGYGAGELNGNSTIGAWTKNADNGALMFLGAGRYNNAPGVFPDIADSTGRVDPYAAGTFAFARACALDADCTNPARSQCGEGGVCGATSGAFFAACMGTTSSCDFSRAQCIRCGGVDGGALTGRCPAPRAPVCRASGECVECTSFTQCTTQKPVCGAASTCVACGHDYGYAPGGDECPAVNAVCKSDGTCTRCTGDADCVGHAVTTCNLTTGSCGAPPTPMTDAGSSSSSGGGSSGSALPGAGAGSDGGGMIGPDAGRRIEIITGPSGGGCSASGNDLPRAILWLAACGTIAWLFRRRRDTESA